MTVRMKEDQIRTAILLMDAIPVMQGEALLALEDLSAERTAACLRLQKLCTPCRGRLQGQVSLSIMTLGFDRFWSTADLLAGRWLRKAPWCARLLGEVARRDPASRLVRGAAFRPTIEPAPAETVPLCPRRATPEVAVGVCPASEDGVEGSDARCRWTPGGLMTAGFDRRCEGLDPGVARGHLQRGRLAMGAAILASALPEAVPALREGGAARLVG
jgi:hypothetical protein